MAQDYEHKTAHAETVIKVAVIRLMAVRLAGEDVQPHGPSETEAAQRLAAELNDGQVDQSSKASQRALSATRALDVRPLEDPGMRRIRGIAANTLLLACQLAAINLREQRRWRERKPHAAADPRRRRRTTASIADHRPLTTTRQ